MTYLLDNYEYNLDEMSIYEISRLYIKFCSVDARVKSKITQLMDAKSDMSVVLELESLINSAV